MEKFITKPWVKAVLEAFKTQEVDTLKEEVISNEQVVAAALNDLNERANIQSDWNESSQASPAYIQNKPTIPAAQVNADWNASSGVAQILNKPTIPTVTGKADKVSNATNGHLAGLDANGNLTDSGFKIVVTDETTYEGMTKDSNTIYLITES